MNCGVSVNRNIKLNIPKVTEAKAVQINLMRGRIKNLYGLNIGGFNEIENHSIGLQLGIFNEANYGFLIQGGAVNFRGILQIGGLNMFSNTQIGLANLGGIIQVGMINFGNIFQVGIFNQSGSYYTFQIGLINKCSNDRFMILLNFCDKDRSENFREFF
ncbi:MAG: hypothetical protein SFU98_13025 [Leptospiraceae bacterium]|nr:hypothetical protein [Leptospiraceae bacterium]